MRVEVVDLAGRRCFILPTHQGWSLVSWPFMIECETSDQRTTIDANRYRDADLKHWMLRLAVYDNGVEVWKELEKQILDDIQSDSWKDRPSVESWFIGNLNQRIEIEAFKDRCCRFFEAWDRQQQEQGTQK